MEQLNLSSERRSVVIRDFENVIARYSDYLTETSDKIISYYEKSINYWSRWSRWVIFVRVIVKKGI